MKHSVETLTPTRVRLTVEVGFDELKPSLDEAYRKIGAGVRIPGFRPGKVPSRIIDQRVGRGAVLEETLQAAVPKFYGEAVREADVPVLGQPDVEVTALEDGERLEFTAEVDVRPEIILPDLDSLSVTVDAVVITDAEIDDQLVSLQDRFAVLSGVDRPAQEGDFVSIDLAATVDGEPVPGGETTGLSYEIGTDSLVPGIDEVLVGMSDGDATTFDTALVAGEFAGRAAQVAVTVRGVKTKDVPALDDDFAQTASEFDTLEELRGDVRNRMGRVRRMEQGVAARDKVLEALLAAVTVDLPESVVGAELAWRRDSMAHQLEHAGRTLEEWLDDEGRTAEEHEEELAKGAADAVKAQLVLDALADGEEIGVDETELTEQVVRRAQRMQISPDEYANQIVSQGQLGALMAEVRRGKALAMALDAATITDSEGADVDLEALRDDLPGARGADDDEQPVEADTADEPATDTAADTAADAVSDTEDEPAAEADEKD